jgi:hypothetical protein
MSTPQTSWSGAAWTGTTPDNRRYAWLRKIRRSLVEARRTGLSGAPASRLEPAVSKDAGAIANLRLVVFDGTGLVRQHFAMISARAVLEETDWGALSQAYRVAVEAPSRLAGLLVSADWLVQKTRPNGRSVVLGSAQFGSESSRCRAGQPVRTRRFASTCARRRRAPRALRARVGVARRSASSARQADAICRAGHARTPGGSCSGHSSLTAAAGCHALPSASFLRIGQRAVVGPAAWLCQLWRVKSALSAAGVPICTW